MARHGENIRKRKDGRWEGRYPVYCEEKGRKIYRSVYGKSYGEVREKLEHEKKRNGGRQRAAPGTGTDAGLAWVPGAGFGAGTGCEAVPEIKISSGPGIQRGCQAASILFTDLAQEWLATVKETKKHSTYVKYRQVFEQHIAGVFGQMELCRLTDGAVRGRIPQPTTDSIQKSVYCVLNQVLKFASRQYGLTVPILQRPAASGRKKPVRPFSRKEQRQLLSVLTCGQDLFKLAMLLCLYTGLRLGEVCALKWEDIDFHSQIITVSRTVQRLYMEGFRTKTVLWESEPKSAHSRREIPISDAVLGLLERVRDGKYGQIPSDRWCQQGAFGEKGTCRKKAQEGGVCGYDMQKTEMCKTGTNIGGYIFGGAKPVEPRTMQNHFKKILREAGLEDRNFHTLRHTFATNCIEGGTDVKSLSELLGHSDVQITLDRYVHPSMDTKRKYLDVLSVFYGQIYGQAG